MATSGDAGLPSLRSTAAVVPLAKSATAPLPVRRVQWRKAVRIIPSIFPPIDLFERVARPEDLDAIHAIESAFNPRLRDAVGDLSLVPPEDRVTGAGAGYIMAAFTHVSPAGSRFSNGTYGIFYAARTEPTAIAETRYHRERFMRATQQDRAELDMRVLEVTIRAPLHDLRGMQSIMPDIYRQDDYTASQILGGALRAGGSSGVVYDSVRCDGGVCAGVFRASRISACRESKHLRYLWDGRHIGEVLEIKRLRVRRI